MEIKEPNDNDHNIAKEFWNRWTPIFQTNIYWREFLENYVANLSNLPVVIQNPDIPPADIKE